MRLAFSLVGLAAFIAMAWMLSGISATGGDPIVPSVQPPDLHRSVEESDLPPTSLSGPSPTETSDRLPPPAPSSQVEGVWENEATLINYLTHIPATAIGSEDTDWIREKYADFPVEALVVSHRQVTQLGFEEAGIYVELREASGDFTEWIGAPGESPPEDMRSNPETAPGVRGTLRYKTVPISGGDVSHRWFRFSPEEYPDLAARTDEGNWLHRTVHEMGDACRICGPAARR